ncbi:ABC transporter permease [Arcticibacterium luteifluviistationis]|uniref:Multidrug ABC transporter permease n=1 Tax=Arcticibacterium luteifluviistationis TaxID=1784714 RepID=A0A2Z4GDW8_9BACT|nr:ABC transporter permease [Arcticibacterium luteifluviistationis]AWV99341.1 multidrug ABC transporter permease [Arcticibacterium luteifluviistationis]
MKVFFAFVRKEFWHVLRDKRSMIILMGLPIVMMLLFGFALTSEVKNSEVGVLDFSKDETTRLLIDRFDQSKYFSVNKVLQSESEIEESFRRGEIRLVIVFPENFQANLLHSNKAQVRLIGDASDPNTSNIMINYASAIFRDYQNELFGQAKLPFQINTETRMLYNPQLKGAYSFVPGVMTLILMLLGAMMTSVSIVKEKETGTMEILLVSPMKPLLVVLSKAVPYLVLCFIDVIIILLMAVYVLDMPIVGSIPLLLAESLLFIFTALSLGLLISAVVDTQQVAMFISLVGFLMPALVFSGFMFPIENMPLPLQIVSNVVPTKWYYNIISNIMVKGLGFAFVMKQTAILFAMTVVFLAIAIKKFKVRLE